MGSGGSPEAPVPKGFPESVPESLAMCLGIPSGRQLRAWSLDESSKGSHYQGPPEGRPPSETGHIHSIMLRGCRTRESLNSARQALSSEPSQKRLVSPRPGPLYSWETDPERCRDRPRPLKGRVRGSPSGWACCPWPSCQLHLMLISLLCILLPSGLLVGP